MPASAHNPKTARCVKHVMSKGHDKVSAIRICQTSTGESYRKAQNSYCATGVGGGIDPTCSPNGSKGSGESSKPAAPKSVDEIPSGSNFTLLRTDGSEIGSFSVREHPLLGRFYEDRATGKQRYASYFKATKGEIRVDNTRVVSWKKGETFAANFRKVSRAETLDGKEYIVAPMTLIVPGVLNGSQGALHYAVSEIAKNYQAWDKIPITVYHPTHNGKPDGRPVSASDKGVLRRQGIGFLKNPQIRNGRLIAEGWFEKDKTKQVDSRVYESLSKNQRMELSTGLYTKNVPAQNGAKDSKGRVYTHEATELTPDHLAILPDQKGACSMNDGCGLNVNSSEESAMKFSRPKTVKYLTTNCDCWKGKEELLSNEEVFSDDDLKKLKTGVENSKKNELIVNAAKEGFKDGDNEYKYDDEQGSFVAVNAGACEEEMEDEEDMPMTPKKDKKKPAMNQEAPKRDPKVQTEEEWFKAAPVGVRNMFLKQKRAMVDRIVANVSDEDERESKAKRLMAKNTEQLEEMLEFIPERTRNEDDEPSRGIFGGDYSGASIPPIGNRQETIDDEEILDIPVMNFREEKEEKRKLQSA